MELAFETAEESGEGVIDPPRRQRVFGVQERVDAMQLQDPEGRRVMLVDIDACPALTATRVEPITQSREEDAHVVGTSKPTGRGGAGLEARFLETKLKELGRIEGMLGGKEGLAQPVSGITKLLEGMRTWLRGGAHRDRGMREVGGTEVEVLVELCHGLARDAAALRKATQESRQRRTELETEQRAVGRGEK
eukprot:282299-Rhodomonas_salina.1